MVNIVKQLYSLNDKKKNNNNRIRTGTDNKVNEWIKCFYITLVTAFKAFTNLDTLSPFLWGSSTIHNWEFVLNLTLALSLLFNCTDSKKYMFLETDIVGIRTWEAYYNILTNCCWIESCIANITDGEHHLHDLYNNQLKQHYRLCTRVPVLQLTR